MIDNTDINTLIVDTIMIDNENQAEFILKKLNEDVAVTNTMKEALSLYEKMLKEKENEWIHNYSIHTRYVDIYG